MGCLLSKKRTSRANCRAGRAAARRESVKFSKDAEAQEDLVAGYYIITLDETENRRTENKPVPIQDLEALAETEVISEAEECLVDRDGMMTMEAGGTNPDTKGPEPTKDPEAKEDHETEKELVDPKDDLVAEIKREAKEPVTKQVAPEIETDPNEERDIEVDPVSISFNLQDQISKLEEKIAWLDERMVSSHIQQDTDITDSEVDYESTILNLQDQISKLEEEITQQDTRRASSHGQRDKAKYSRRGKNREGMLDNLNVLLELNETKWLKQTLEKALSAIRQIPQATPTKKQITKEDSTSSDNMADSASLDSE